MDLDIYLHVDKDIDCVYYITQYENIFTKKETNMKILETILSLVYDVNKM